MRESFKDSWFSRLLIPLVMFSLLTSLFAFSVKILFKSKREAFEASAVRTYKLLEDETASLVFGLQGAKGSVVANNMNFDAENFRKYAESRDLFGNFSSALGFGLIRMINNEALTSYIEQERQKRPNFNIHPNVTTDQHMVIEAIEPVEVNGPAVGLDISFEANRRSAAMYSAITGKIALTKKIKLVQKTVEHSGFLYFVPIYRSHITPKNEQERLRTIIGWAYAPVVLENLLQRVRSKISNNINITLSVDSAEDQTPKNQGFKPDVFSQVMSLDFPIGGQIWKLEVCEIGSDILGSLFGITFVYLLILVVLILAMSLAQKRNSEANDSLYKKTEWLNAVVKSAGYSVIATDPKGIITTFNPTAEAMLGYQAAEVIGIASPAIIHDPNEVVDRAKILSDELGKVVEPGFETFVAKPLATGLSYIDDWTYIKKNGERFRVRLCITVLYDSDKEIIGFLGIAEDLTEHLKILEAERKASRVKSEFLSTMSHEIRTPLNGVIGAADILASTSLDLHQKEYLSSIVFSANVLNVLVNDILDFQKIDSGKMQFHLHPTDILHFLEEGLHPHQLACKRKNLEFIFEAKGSTAIVMADQKRLGQVINNLLSNAIKFTNKGQIFVTSALEVDGHDARLRFSVKDSGIGIPKASISKLFEPFFQADASISQTFGGTGLGLAIVKRLVDLMGGKLTVESVESVGSTFSFSVPLKLAENILSNSEEADDEVAQFVWHVLVAEDNIVNQNIIRQMLRMLGCTCKVVSNGQEAINALKVEGFDLVIMDCRMPVLDGVEATRIIRSDLSGKQKDVKIIALTAEASNSDREVCLAAGMNGFISKPVTRKSLARAMASFLNRK